MNDYKKIFAEKGYSLFEPESVEMAIISALKKGEIRYILGIPVVIENSEIDYNELLRIAKNEGVINETKDVLRVTAKIIKSATKKKALKKLANRWKAKKIFDEKEFREAYEKNYSRGAPAFEPRVNYPLSQIFAPKQISILYKLKNGIKLSKTEREQYSRTIKKRLNAIISLREFAEWFVK